MFRLGLLFHVLRAWKLSDVVVDDEEVCPAGALCPSAFQQPVPHGTTGLEEAKLGCSTTTLESRSRTDWEMIAESAQDRQIDVSRHRLLLQRPKSDVGVKPAALINLGTELVGGHVRANASNNISVQQLDQDAGAEGAKNGAGCTMSASEARARVTEVPLSSEGFEVVKQLCCPVYMQEFIRRVIQDHWLKDVCIEGALSGTTLWFYCNDARGSGNNWSTLLQATEPGSESRVGKCPWIGTPPYCPVAVSCLDFPGLTQPPCQQTTAKPITWTTTTTTVSMLNTDGGNTRNVSFNLTSKDFRNGSVILSAPGAYTLEEDITFEPTPVFPGLNDTTYRQGDGYFLGFFAAIVIQGANITLDCKNKNIKMSAKLFQLQRFFSIIELGSRPFILGQGPPPLASRTMSPGPFIAATNVTIMNCNFGKSSHHGIHGNSAQGVTLKNIRIRDFEVGGISLNGASGVKIEDVRIGPSSREAYSAELSQAIFLNHMTNIVGKVDREVWDHFATVNFTLRGQNTTADTVFKNLQTHLNNFLTNGSGDLAPVIGQQGLPDGSAIYGILIHKTGVATDMFGAHPMQKINGTVIFENHTSIRNAKVFGLELAPEAWARLEQNGKQAQGPAGAVFRHKALEDAQGHYVGNPLSDAHVAIGHVLKSISALQSSSPNYSVIAQRINTYYPATFMPDEILDWATGGKPFNYSKFDVFCCEDAMSHHNKGVIGLRVSYQNFPVLENISVANLINRGGDDFKRTICNSSGAYEGNNVFGVIYENCLLSGAQKRSAAQALAQLNQPNGSFCASGLHAGVGGRAILIHNLRT